MLARIARSASTIVLIGAVLGAAVAFSKGVPVREQNPCQNLGVSYGQALCARGQLLELRKLERRSRQPSSAAKRRGTSQRSEPSTP